jgi:hypothetical protein
LIGVHETIGEVIVGLLYHAARRRFATVVRSVSFVRKSHRTHRRAAAPLVDLSAIVESLFHGVTHDVEAAVVPAAVLAMGMAVARSGRRRSSSRS